MRLAELKEKLVQRGYRSKAVDSAFEKVRQLDRDTILRKVDRDDTNVERVKAVFKFDKRLPNLSSIFTKNWRTMLKDDQRLTAVFPDPPLVCFTRG